MPELSFTVVCSYEDVDQINPEKKNVHYIFNYETFSKTLYTLFILSTLDNYPDALLGIINERPFLLIFFFCFTIFSAIIMISIMTGVFYTHFKDIYSENVDKLVGEKQEYKM